MESSERVKSRIFEKYEMFWDFSRANNTQICLIAGSGGILVHICLSVNSSFLSNQPPVKMLEKVNNVRRQ